MRHTSRAILIKDGVVLLVTGHGANYYWTPGGGIKHGESPEDALRRELHEELGVTLKTYEEYSSYTIDDQHVRNFLVEIEGDIKPSGEISKLLWYTTDCHERTSEGFKNKVLPDLIRDGLVR